MNDTITIGSLVDAIEAGSLPLHIAIQLSDGGWDTDIRRLWAVERDAHAMYTLLWYTGTAVPVATSVAVAVEAANLAALEVWSGYSQSHVRVAEAALRDMALTKQFCEVMEDVETSAETYARDGSAGWYAWKAIVDALASVRSYVMTSEEAAQHAASDAIASADYVFELSVFSSGHARAEVSNLLRRHFGPPTLEQIIAAAAKTIR